jgi:hypothetical protein
MLRVGNLDLNIFIVKNNGYGKEPKYLRFFENYTRGYCSQKWGKTLLIDISANFTFGEK